MIDIQKMVCYNIIRCRFYQVALTIVIDCTVNRHFFRELLNTGAFVTLGEAPFCYFFCHIERSEISIFIEFTGFWGALSSE